MKSGAGAWLLGIGLLLAVGGGYLTWRSIGAGPAPAGEVPGVTEFRERAALPAFTLRGPRGEFTEANLRGKWTLMFFGYTQCPDICPTALNLLKQLKAVPDASTAVPPAPTFQGVFVSVDPRRDSHELIAQYLAAFDPSFIGISGDDRALAPLAGMLGVFYQRHDSAGTRNYSVDHSAAIHLIDPQGRLAAVFPPPQDFARMAADFRRIVRQ